MPGSYSKDLRERVLVAVEAGEPVDAVAEQFMVGRSSVYRWITASRDDGRRVPKRLGGGPKPLIHGEREAALYSAMMALIARCGGNVSSEHGVGSRKRDYVGMSHTDADIAAMRAVKAAFDPSGYLNAAVLFD